MCPMSEATRLLSYKPKATDLWRTPPSLYERLDAEFQFRLDAACESGNQMSPKGLCVDLGRSGLMEPWDAYGGAVWCNPPYSRIRPWLEQALRAGRNVPVVMLVPADTSTRWWYECVARDAAEVRFLMGRIRFVCADGSKPRHTLSTASAVVIYRPSGGPPRYSYMESGNA